MVVIVFFKFTSTIVSVQVVQQSKNYVIYLFVGFCIWLLYFLSFLPPPLARPHYLRAQWRPSVDLYWTDKEVW